MKVNEIKKSIIALTGRENVAESLAMPLFCLRSQAIAQKGICLRAPAGTGKTGTVRRCAEAAGVEFYSVSVSGLSVDALITGDAENGGKWPGLQEICKLGAPPAIVFFDELHSASDKVEQWLMSALDPEQDIKGIAGAWEMNRERFLVVVGTNEGIPNPALCGPSGRLIDLPLLPLSPEQVTKKAIEYGKEKLLSFSPSGLAMVRFYSPATFRGVENLIHRVFTLMAGDIKEVTAIEVDRAAKAGNCPPDGMTEVEANILRYLAKSGASRLGSIKAAVAGELSTKAFSPLWSAARGKGYIVDVTGGFCLSSAGVEYVKGLQERRNAILAMDTAPAPAPAKGKGKGKAKK